MSLIPAYRYSVAPMMDWTDRHCRFLHRLMSQRCLLHTEMIAAPAVVRGDTARLLSYSSEEHPVALQLGGSDPAELADAARVAIDFGYDEINFNVGCPSDRVKDSCFGVILMARPDHVADCVRAMLDATGGMDVTVKCRIGVDDCDAEQMLGKFIEAVSEAGVRRIAVHARKAWLAGLNPKQNRNVPPLDYALVLKMKSCYPNVQVCLNGGITSIEMAEGFLDQGLDGVMVGRFAYQMPSQLLLDADRRIFGDSRIRTRKEVVMEMLPYMDDHLSTGGKLHQITRHMLGIFAGVPGAKLWRRALSDNERLRKEGVAAVEKAMTQVVDVAF